MLKCVSALRKQQQAASPTSTTSELFGPILFEFLQFSLYPAPAVSSIGTKPRQLLFVNCDICSASGSQAQPAWHRTNMGPRIWWQLPPRSNHLNYLGLHSTLDTPTSTTTMLLNIAPPFTSQTRLNFYLLAEFCVRVRAWFWFPPTFYLISTQKMTRFS